MSCFEALSEADPDTSVSLSANSDTDRIGCGCLIAVKSSRVEC